MVGIIIGKRIAEGDDILSFIESVLGILATYGAFYLGCYNEKKRLAIRK